MKLYLPNDLLKRGDADVSDLTSAKPTGERYWEPGDMFVRPMDREPTEAEQVEIRRRWVTADAADEKRLHDLIAAQPATEVERLWRDTELAKYGEVPPPPPTEPAPPVKGNAVAGMVSTGTLKAGTAKNVKVTYDTPFEVAPKVTPTILGADASVERRVTVVSESKTGCVLSVYRGTGTASFDVNWIAVTP